MMSMIIRIIVLFGLALSGMGQPLTAQEFQLRVVDAETKKPISVRMSIRNARGSLIKQRGIPFHGGQFCFFGKHNFKLPRGIYSYTIEKGLEYRTVSGQFEIKRGANDGVTVSIPRFTNLSDKGWWPGDLSVQRRFDDIPVLMDANDLSFVNFIAETNDGLRIKKGFPKPKFKSVNERMAYSQTGAVDSRLGGSLVWVGLEKPLTLTKDFANLPLRISKEPPPGNPFVFLKNASAWDLPVLLAEKRLDSEKGLAGISIAGGSLTPKPKKSIPKSLRHVPKAFPGEHPTARWQTAIYFHVLNCGFKIPPVAHSDSGESINSTGYNRTYVHTGQKFDPDRWMENLKHGRVVVTNGPVMNVLYSGVLPGETFLVDEGKSIEIEPTLTLSLKEKAEYLEIIRNGFVAEQISLDEYAKARGKLPKIRFTESGWMAVRVVCSNKDTYRFALSAPVYVQVGSRNILKRKSAKFFLDWIIERAKMLRSSKLPDKDKAVEQMRPAYEFWKDLVEKS